MDINSRDKALDTIGKLYAGLKPDQIVLVRDLSWNMAYLFEFIDLKEACRNDNGEIVTKMIKESVSSRKLPVSLLLPLL